MRKHCKLDRIPDFKLLFGKSGDTDNPDIRKFKQLQYKEDQDKYCNGNILDDKNFNRYCKRDCRSLIDMGDYYECALEMSFDENGELCSKTREKNKR